MTNLTLETVTAQLSESGATTIRAWDRSVMLDAWIERDTMDGRRFVRLSLTSLEEGEDLTVAGNFHLSTILGDAINHLGSPEGWESWG